MHTYNEEMPSQETYYIEYLNKANGFKKDRIEFDSYRLAKQWAIDNLDNFHPDMIRMVNPYQTF
jgi:hypothetical protein